MPPLAIEAENLGRIYKIRGTKKEKAIRKELVALADVNLKIEQGELFGLLGPNGAGKTTLIKILTTLLAPTSGFARVAGHDVIAAPQLVRSLIGNVAQAFPTLAGFGNLELLGILVGLSIVFGVASIFIFRICDRRARERGLIDRTTNY